MTESVVGLITHEMIISNASDEEMSDEKSLACRVGESVATREDWWGGKEDMQDSVSKPRPNASAQPGGGGGWMR